MDIDNELKQGRYADFNHTVKIYEHVFTTSSLRYYVFHSKHNGLDQVISRLGKKLIFNLDKLELWLSQGGAK